MMLYLQSLISDKEEKIKYLKTANKYSKKNYTIIKELLDLNIMPEGIDIDELIALDLNSITKIPYNPYNIEENLNEPLKEISFMAIGGGNNIGGSCYLLKLDNFTIMIDCGIEIVKGNNITYPDFENIKNFGLNTLDDIDLILFTHAHLDHIGAIVQLYKRIKNKKDKPILMTKETKKLTLKNFSIEEDKFYIQEVLNSVKEVNFREKTYIKKGHSTLKIEFFSAGHILGAASIYLELDGKGIFITGDYSLQKQKTVNGMDIPKGYKIDLLITENTYGSNINNSIYPRKIEEEIFKHYIKSTMKEEKRALIPAFALGRAQEVICLLKECFEEKFFWVYIDGLVTDICKIYKEFKINDFENILYANENQGYDNKYDFIEREIMNKSCCIVASSGMLKDGSASSYYGEKILPDKSSTCILTGYQDEESPGGVLKNEIENRESKYLQLNGNIIKVNCDIKEYYLSAHCSFEEIIKFIFEIKPKTVILVHGKVDKGEKTEINEKLSLIKNLQVIQSFNGEVYKLSL